MFERPKSGERAILVNIAFGAPPDPEVSISVDAPRGSGGREARSAKGGMRVASMSADPLNPVRSFHSFSQAARENAESRVMAGIHFRFAIETGLALGQDIGRYTVTTFLQPTSHAVTDAAR